MTPPAPGPDRITDKAPQTAFWHHVWAANDGRAALKRLRGELLGVARTITDEAEEGIAPRDPGRLLCL